MLPTLVYLLTNYQTELFIHISVSLSLLGTGESPAPFTQITNKEICDGVWMPRLEKHLVTALLSFIHSFL